MLVYIYVKKVNIGFFFRRPPRGGSNQAFKKITGGVSHHLQCANCSRERQDGHPASRLTRVIISVLPLCSVDQTSKMVGSMSDISEPRPVCLSGCSTQGCLQHSVPDGVVIRVVVVVGEEVVGVVVVAVVVMVVGGIEMVVGTLIRCQAHHRRLLVLVGICYLEYSNRTRRCITLHM